MARIYTRKGDDGSTSLIGGGRVAKDSPVIEAGGALDELNALIGVVRSRGLDGSLDAILQTIQSDLLTIGGEIATPSGTASKGRTLGGSAILDLEGRIDSLEKQLAPLNHFILPGGSPAAAEMHLARAVARRAERRCVALMGTGGISPDIIRYLNRLSDLCFVLARFINRLNQVPEKRPSKGER
jgi:cob(I)alamin adenosyltransferase